MAFETNFIFSCAGSSLLCGLFSSCSEGAVLQLSGQLLIAMEHKLWGVWAQELWHMGLGAPWHVGSSQARD